MIRAVMPGATKPGKNPSALQERHDAVCAKPSSVAPSPLLSPKASGAVPPTPAHRSWSAATSMPCRAVRGQQPQQQSWL